MPEYRKYWSPMETMPREKLKEIQLEKIKWIVRYAYEMTPFYRKLYDEAGVKPDDIKTIDDFIKRVPVFRKDDIRRVQRTEENPDIFGGMLAVPLKDVLYVGSSSGTTGLPSFFTHTAVEMNYYAEAFARAFWGMGIRPGMTVTGDLMHYVGSVLPIVLSFEMIGTRLMRASLLPFHPGHCTFETKYGKAHAGIYVVDVALLGIQEMKRFGFDPKEVFASTKIMITSSDVLTPVLRKKIEEEAGVEIYHAFITSDNASFASAECEVHDGKHIWQDLYFSEIVDPDTNEPLPPGERGEHVVTALFRTGMPTIRFGTEDLAVMNEEPCPCGRTHPRARCLGRSAWRIKHEKKYIDIYDIILAFESFKETETALFTVVKDAPVVSKLRLRAAYDQAITKDPEKLRLDLEAKLKQTIGVEAEIEWTAHEKLPRVAHKIIRITDESKK